MRIAFVEAQRMISFCQEAQLEPPAAYQLCEGLESERARLLPNLELAS